MFGDLGVLVDKMLENVGEAFISSSRWRHGKERFKSSFLILKGLGFKSRAKCGKAKLGRFKKGFNLRGFGFGRFCGELIRFNVPWFPGGGRCFGSVLFRGPSEKAGDEETGRAKKVEVLAFRRARW